jgi:hypothetical protein
VVVHFDRHGTSTNSVRVPLAVKEMILEHDPKSLNQKDVSADWIL